MTQPAAVRTGLALDADIFADIDSEATEGGKRVIIGHGVNVQNVMGAGFAALVAKRYPQVLPPYAQACADGTLFPGTTQFLGVDAAGTCIANIASQRVPGRDARPDWMRAALSVLYTSVSQYPGPVEVRLPLIGAGIGGLIPTQAADIIFESADAAGANVHTRLFLLPSDAHTADVTARHAWWYRLDGGA